MSNLSKSDIPKKKPFKVWITYGDEGWTFHSIRDGEQEKTWGPSTFKPDYFGSKELVDEICQDLGVETEEESIKVRNKIWRSGVTGRKPSEEDEKEPLEYEGGKGKGHSHADLLVMLCLAQKPILFYDQHQTPYAKIVQNKVNVTVPIRSRQFKSWLAGLLWQAKQKAPGSEALMSARNVLESMALHDGNQYMLYNRVAPAEDGIWIDMTDGRWRAIKVTADGWFIVDNPPILFRRYSHQKPLPDPIRGGNIWRFLDFVNLEKDDEKTRLVLVVTIVSYLIPEVPHVILVFYGVQGSGKSMVFKLIRRLIDPSSAETLTMPRDENERVQQLAHHWCAFYDNQTQIPTWISDTLCRAATGGGFTKRELYTDDEDIIHEFMRCVGINGINIAASRGDLLDRSLLVGLKDIPTNKRREEKTLLADFEGCKAEILGGVLDTLSKALKMYPTINPAKLFRMADYTRWGCAIAQALGKTEKDFLDAYETKVNAQIEEAAASSVVATVLLDFMANRNEWEDTPSQLYKELIVHAKILGISTHQKSFPKAPHVLVRQLNELIPALKALGITVETEIRTTGGIRRIYIKSVTSVPTVNPNKKPDTSDASDGTFPISSKSFQLEEVITKLPSVPSSEGIEDIIHNNDLSKTGFNSEKNHDLQDVNVDKEPSMPQEVGAVGNSVTEEAKAVFRWKQVKPSEKCPLCGKLAVEYEISIDKDTLLRRCNVCYNLMRTKFTKAKWVLEENEQLNKKGEG